MYKIHAIGCVNNATDEKENSFNSISDLTSVGLVAQTCMLDTIQNICRMRESLQPHHRSSIAEFNSIRDKTVEQIKTAAYKGQTVFDGHVDFDVVFTDDAEGSVRVRVPDLLSLLDKFQTNFSELSRVDAAEFARRVIASEQSQLNPSAAVQGVRLNTFLTRTVKSSRIEAVNSLSRLSGLHVTSYGNALISPQPCNQTQMPVDCACIRINGISIDGCDGTVESLIEQINVSTAQHGVHAVAVEGQPMTLISYSGHKIEIAVSNQAGSLLSGFPPGVTDVPSQSCGLLVWISFLPIHTVTFDCVHTGKLITGIPVTSIALKPSVLKDLSIDTPMQRQLTTYVLEALQRIVQRESDCLTQGLLNLNNLLRDNSVENPDQSDQKVSHQLIGP